MKSATEPMIRRKYQLLGEIFNERERRLWAAVEASQLGRGGISTVARATGRSRTTISPGVAALGQEQTGAGCRRQRVRSQGGGRPRLPEKAPPLVASLAKRVEPTTHGAPESPWRWTGKRTPQLAAGRQKPGLPVGRPQVSELVAPLGYRLHAQRQPRQGSAAVDRDAQFEHRHAPGNPAQPRGQPGISGDPPKTERLGDFKNSGREWQPRGQPVAGRPHDVLDRGLGTVSPPMGAMSRPPPPAGSAAAPITPPPRLRWSASAAGG
jgi:hypothetical protein